MSSSRRRSRRQPKLSRISRRLGVSSLKNSIRSSLRSVGKGWFNLEEKTREVYEIGKLRKFMYIVRFCMQDSLRWAAEDSLESFAGLFESASAYEIDVVSPNEVVCMPLEKTRVEYDVATGQSCPAGSASQAVTDSWDDSVHPPPRARPLFSIDVVVKDGKICYGTPLEAFEEQALLRFDKAIAHLACVPDLEPHMLSNLKWAYKPMVETVHRLQDHIVAMRWRLQAALRRALAPLHEYLRTYIVFQSDVNMNLAEMDMNLVLDTVAKTRAEIERYRERAEFIKGSVPRSIDVGMFHINCESVLRELQSRVANALQFVLDALASRLRSRVNELCDKFMGISRQIRELPLNIEELVELRKFMTTIPQIAQEQMTHVHAIMDDYEALDEYHYRMLVEDFTKKWILFGWPQRLMEERLEIESRLEVAKIDYENDLKVDQENFETTLQELMRVVSGFSRHSNIAKVQEVATEVRRITIELRKCEERAKLFREREVLFGLDVTRYDHLDRVVREFEPFRMMWMTTSNWLRWHEQWTTETFLSLNADAMEQDVSNAWKTMTKTLKHFKEIPGCLAIAERIKGEIESFRPHMPLILALRSPGMRERHWDELSSKLGINLHPDEAFKLPDLFALQLEQHFDRVDKVTGVASKEYAIEAALDRMESEWADMDFEIVAYKVTGTYRLRATDDISQLLDDHIVMTQSMSFSVYKKPFEERIEKWEATLKLVQEILDEWLACQTRWLYLEPIFSSDDINRQMPTEGKRYVTMDRIWRKVMDQAFSRPRVIPLCSGNQKLLDSLTECTKLLDLVARGLSDYIETKRAAFQRFYFLSNEELLEILSDTKDPTKVQPHLHKCFEQIASLTFADDGHITHMNSTLGESVALDHPFEPVRNVELWLRTVDERMVSTLRGILIEATARYVDSKRGEWGARMALYDCARWELYSVDSHCRGGPEERWY